MPRKVAFGLLIAGIYLFWLLLTAPARLLTFVLPDGVRSASSPEPYGKVRPDS
jgi:general secretion pathway protein N